AHLRAAEAARATDAHALGAKLHRRAEGLLHRTAERDAALELCCDVLGHELRVRLRLAHLLDVDEDLVRRERLDAGELGFTLGGRVEVAALQDLDTATTLTNHHPRATREDDDLDLVRGALDFHARDVGVVEI